MERENVIYVLWTGGWDSTYRICELSRQDVVVQPIYCIDKKRGSLERELQSIREIYDLLKKKKETKAEILPIIKVDKEALPENQEIRDAFLKICDVVRLGPQYEWLAKLSKRYKGLEIGVEKPGEVLGGCSGVMAKFGGEMQFDQNGVGYLSPELATRECFLILGDFRFPIIKKEERDMISDIKRWGYQDVMEHIWFCHYPSNGKPCGMCNPCKLKMQRRMQFLLPFSSRMRYHYCGVVETLFGRDVRDKIEIRYRKRHHYAIQNDL